MNLGKLVVSSSPHVHAELTTQKIMMWVLIALAPSGVMGVWYYGLRALAIMIVCVASCVLSEYAWQKLTHRPVTVGDLSAAVTGLMLAFNLPVSIPLWMSAVGGAFAIIVVKQFYGGLGCNIVNPALAGRAMMLASWPVAMTTWTLDGVTTATPLALIKAGQLDQLPSLTHMLVGYMGGSLGETCKLALLAGFAILLWKKIITWHVPVIYIITVSALCTLFGRGAPMADMLAGGLFLGAIFMATDYATSPITLKGKVIYALGCGALTAVIRTWGGYPEGFTYAILVMNLTVPLIDRATKPRIFGEVKKHEK
ncbi:MAG: RnfABCDGE type electron transport complex subunit D [Pyramidobacter sp.]|nr:RnfABCDGE type electron transport complex subunit D [Pyramidobacter sp.]MBP3751982.1 RnfABCDGE type electron transport complex subunit D [Pyramidobacter sp.]